MDDLTGRRFPLTDLQAGFLVGASRLLELGGFAPAMHIEVTATRSKIEDRRTAA